MPGPALYHLSRVSTLYFFFCLLTSASLWPLPHCVTIGLFFPLDQARLFAPQSFSRRHEELSNASSLRHCPRSTPRVLWAPTPQVMRRGFLSHASRLDAGGAFG